MTYLPRSHQAGHFRHRHQPRVQILAAVELNRASQTAVLHQDGEAGVAHDGRIGKHPADDAGALAFVAGFLAQLAATCRFRRGIMRVHYSAGDFQFDRVGAVAVLLNHHHKLIGRDGHHVHPVGRIHHHKFMFAARSRRFLQVRPELENSELAQRPG